MEYLFVFGQLAINGPLERTRLLLQGQGENIKNGNLSTPYKNSVDCLQRIWRVEGK